MDLDMTFDAMDALIERRRRQLAKLINGPAKPGRKPEPKAAKVPVNRALLPTFDGVQTATLASGQIVQIDPIDAGLLTFGGWRYGDRHGVFCQKQTDKCRTRFLLADLVLQAAGNPASATGAAASYLVYVNGDKTDLRRVNLKRKASKTACPFDAAKLGALYWQSGKTLCEIGALAAKKNGVAKYPHETVRRWLKRAGVPLKNDKISA